jgi:putative ABC transport system permease protein
VTIVTLGLSVLSGIFFGLAPAWQAGRMDIQSILKESGRSKASGSSGSRIRTALVTVQVAASLILLIGAILMIRTFENMKRLNLGFEPSNILTLRVDYDSKIIQGGVETWRFYKRAIDAVRNQPGVESASAANFLPFGSTWTDDFATEEKPERTWTALYNPILPEYFHTMRIPLTAGRDFTEMDNDVAAPVVIVDQSFAERTWPGENPIGKRLTLHPASKNNKKSLEVVGVAGDTRLSIRSDERPQIYVPFGSDYGFFLMVAVRTKTDPANLAPLLRRALEGAGGNRPVWDIRTMDDYLSLATAETRFALFLLSVLAAVAVVLCVIGVYGVVSYSISERMQEFAIRIAVGAQSGNIVRLVLIRSLIPAVAGVAIGMASAYALTRFLRTMLFNVSPTDTLTYVLASTALLAAALAACYVPIRSLALRTNPRKFLL